MNIYRSQVLVCGGTGCTSSGSALLIDEFEKQLKENGLYDEFWFVRAGTNSYCLS